MTSYENTDNNLKKESKNILIVDDSLFMRTVLKDILKRTGYEIIDEASNGLEAIEKFKQSNPDFVLLDIAMPELNGIEALKEIMSISPEAKVIMCSALGDRGMVMEALRYGAKDFIIKPFQPDQLLESLEKASMNFVVSA